MNPNEKNNVQSVVGLSRTRVMTECAMMVALATVLSLLKIAQMPAGGSVTAAAMMPLVLVSYRHGTKAGLSSSLVFALLQALLGTRNFSYVTGWASVLSVLFLDYVAAYAVVGFSGLFRGTDRPARDMALGTVFVCVLRYLCHTVTGAVIWATCAVALPDAAAWGYSAVYNAAYMVPETIVNAIAVAYAGSVLDLKNPEVRPRKRKAEKRSFPAHAVGSFVAALALIYDVLTVFSHCQDEDGFSVSALRTLPLTPLLAVTAIGVFAYIAGLLLEKRFPCGR